MDGVAKKRRGVGATVLCLVLGAGIADDERAQAAPPPARATFPARNPVEPVEPRAARSSGLYGEFGRLDLRAPADLPGPHAAASGPPGGDSAGALLAFPRRAAASAPIANQPADNRLRELGSSGPPMKVMSRAEEFAHRFRREGLPLARLWESRTALVSLGLSPRGKPGIWLIQRVP